MFLCNLVCTRDTKNRLNVGVLHVCTEDPGGSSKNNNNNSILTSEIFVIVLISAIVLLIAGLMYKQYENKKLKKAMTNKENIASTTNPQSKEINISNIVSTEVNNNSSIALQALSSVSSGDDAQIGVDSNETEEDDDLGLYDTDTHAQQQTKGITTGGDVISTHKGGLPPRRQTANNIEEGVVGTGKMRREGSSSNDNNAVDIAITSSFTSNNTNHNTTKGYNAKPDQKLSNQDAAANQLTQEGE